MLGAFAAVFIALLGAFSGYEKRAFDAYGHMFLGDHYLRQWFDLWDTRWYGGFSIVTYPPLAHQLMATLARIFGHEAAFVLIIFTMMVVAPLAVGRVARLFADSRTAALAILLAALWPTAQRVAYVYGQITTICGTVFVLLAIIQLDDWLRDGRLVHLAAFAGFIGAVAGVHHLTMVFGAWGCVLVGAGHLFFSGEPFSRVIRRLAVAGPLAALTVLAVAWPFITFAQGEPQAEIPHFTRDPIFQRAFNVELVEQVVALVLSIACSIFLLRRREAKLGLFSLAILFLLVLSLGGTTPLPQWLFGRQWRWLVYDRFFHWGALLLAVPLAHTLRLLGLESARFLTVVAACLLPVTLLSVSHRQADALQPKFIQDIGPLLAVLNQPEAERYRHLTLGFGEQGCRLPIYGKSPSIDGGYHTARRNPLLRKSGIGSLDSAKYFPAGHDILRAVLADADASSLRWVFVYDEWYYTFLFEAGFIIKEVWPNGVTLFERDSAAPISDAEVHMRGPRAWAWGILPLLCLATGVSMAILALAQQRQRRREDEPHERAGGPDERPVSAS